MQETVRSEKLGLKTEVGNSLQSEIRSYSAVVKSSTTCTADVFLNGFKRWFSRLYKRKRTVHETAWVLVLRRRLMRT